MRVKERRRGEGQQEGCVSCRAQKGRGKELHQSLLQQGEQAVVRGQAGNPPRPEKEKKGSYEGAQGRARQGAEVSRPGMRWEASKLLDPAAAATTAPLCSGQQGQAQAEAGSLASQPGAERCSTAGEQAGGPEAF